LLTVNHKKGGNHLKKILILILTLISIISISIVANAYGPGPGYPPPPYWGPPPGDRMEARRVLDETRDYIFRAQRVAHRYQQGDLRRAFDIQADARNLYRQWHYHRAIQLSLHARGIARDIIEEAERRDPPPPPPYHRHYDRRSSIHINLNL
jgi:hypothetical protein